MQRRSILLTAAGLAVLVAAVLLAVVVPGAGAPGRSTPAVEVVPVAERVPLPAFSGEAVAAGAPAVDTGKLRGRPLVVNFWASWCGPCRAEQRALERSSRRLAPLGVGFLGINVRDDRAAAGAYLTEFEVSYPSLYDRAGRFAQALRALAPAALPATIVVDAEGRVAARVHGVLPGADPDAQVAELERVVAEVTGVRVPAVAGASG